jgi:hypothetical protein
MLSSIDSALPVTSGAITCPILSRRPGRWPSVTSHGSRRVWDPLFRASRQPSWPAQIGRSRAALSRAETRPRTPSVHVWRRGGSGLPGRYVGARGLWSGIRRRSPGWRGCRASREGPGSATRARVWRVRYRADAGAGQGVVQRGLAVPLGDPVVETERVPADIAHRRVALVADMLDGDVLRVSGAHTRGPRCRRASCRTGPPSACRTSAESATYAVIG